MKLRVLLASAALAATSLLAVAPAHAGQICYDVQANVAGTEVVNQAGCQDI